MGRDYEPMGQMEGRSCGYNSFACPKEWRVYFPPDIVVNPFTGGTYDLSPSGPLDELVFWTGVFYRWRSPLIISEFFIGHASLWCGNGYEAIVGEPTDPAWCIFAGYEPLGMGWEFAHGKWFLQSPILAPPPLPIPHMVSFEGFGDMTAVAKPWNA
jgi:hypothetical protein